MILVSIATIDLPKQITNKDILNGMDGPKRLNHTLEMLYDNCYDKNNFTIQVIIDDDQDKIYEEVLTKWEIEPSLISKGKNWSNLYKAQHDKLRELNPYFFMFMPDDLIGLSKDWDKAIMDKKGSFKDDLFVLHTKYYNGKRNVDTYSKCYESIDDTTKHFEEQPIWTYKFGEFFIYLYDEGILDNARELLLAALLHLLNKKGFNRHVECDLTYKEIICQNNNSLKVDGGYGEYLAFLKTDDKDKIIENIIQYIEKEK